MTNLHPDLVDVLHAAANGDIRLVDGTCRHAFLDVTEEVNDLCGRGLLYNDGGRLAVLAAGEQLLLDFDHGGAR